MPFRLAHRCTPTRAAAAGGLILALAASACGGSSTGSSGTAADEPARKPTPLSLDVTSHDNWGTVRAHSTVLRGLATRGARLEIDGRAVTVNAEGRWRKTVGLSMGDNSFSLEETKQGTDDVRSTLNLTRRRTAAERVAWRHQQEVKRQQRLARERAERQQRIANFKASAVTIPYKQLEKNADRFEGKHVKYTGQIFQIQEDEYGGGIMLISVTNDGYGYWDDNVWVDYDGNVKGAEDDVVTVYGTITGSKSYETQIGGETYVPQMRARYIEE
jgi:hypothetical protein